MSRIGDAPRPDPSAGIEDLEAERRQWAEDERRLEKFDKALTAIERVIGREILYNLIASGLLLAIPGLLAVGAVGAAVHGVVEGFRKG